MNIDSKTLRILRIFKFVVYVTLGVLIAIFHDAILQDLDAYLAGLLFVYGSEAIAFAFLYHRNEFYHQRRFFWGISEIALGLIVLLGVDEFSHICILWAVWSILRESEEIREGVMDFKHYLTSIPSLIESVANMVLSIMLIIHPEVEHATTHLYLLIAELVLVSGLPLINIYYYKQKEVVSERV